MYWPIALIVLSNVFYHICSKETPSAVNPFASLTVTYGVGVLASLVLYFVTQKGGSLLSEYRQVNWVSFVFGLTLVGLEAGYIYLYKAGWEISVGSLIASVLLAIALIVVGVLLYKETISLRKVAGVILCLVGLYFINQ
jgi:drug/metabolite transporter (DMT)-like permease